MNAAAVTKAILECARRLGWVITRSQCLNLGASSAQLTALARAGVLVRAHPGVYVVAGAVGAPDDHALATRAALAAVGPAGVASHWTAAWLQNTVLERPNVVDITVAGEREQRLTGVRIHRSTRAVSNRQFQGLPCTLPARTLVDIAATATPAQLADAIDRARANRIVRLSDLEAEARPSRRKRRGVGALRRELGRLGHIGGPTASVLESRMARLIRTYGLPEPRAERIAGPDGRYRIDYTYDQVKLAVELYGYASHSSPAQLRKDTARQNELILAGWTVLIFTWPDVTDEPAHVAAQIRAALGR
jgi:very-short-patch-repair endonuclease